ncbi:MAG: hypothetical protein KTR25_15990 [Myxococcales bacterium]|nr:hypothetical protein [Myxococcales bacterium]
MARGVRSTDALRATLGVAARLSERPSIVIVNPFGELFEGRIRQGVPLHAWFSVQDGQVHFCEQPSNEERRISFELNLAGECAAHGYQVQIDSKEDFLAEEDVSFTVETSRYLMRFLADEGDVRANGRAFPSSHTFNNVSDNAPSHVLNHVPDQALSHIPNNISNHANHAWINVSNHSPNNASNHTWNNALNYAPNNALNHVPNNAPKNAPNNVMAEPAGIANSLIDSGVGSRLTDSRGPHDLTEPSVAHHFAESVVGHGPDEPVATDQIESLRQQLRSAVEDNQMLAAELSKERYTKRRLENGLRHVKQQYVELRSRIENEKVMLELRFRRYTEAMTLKHMKEKTAIMAELKRHQGVTGNDLETKPTVRELQDQNGEYEDGLTPLERLCK